MVLVRKIYLMWAIVLLNQLSTIGVAAQEIFYSECGLSDGTERYIFVEAAQETGVTQAVAKSECLKRNSSTLGRVGPQEELDFFEEFLAKHLLNETEYWIGLESKEDAEEDSQDTTRFTSVDGEIIDQSFFSEPGENPWRSSQPNNNNGPQNCVA